MKVKSDHRSKFSNLSNWKEEAWKKKSGLQALIFFQASSFQLLKLENLLRWSLFTFSFFICSLEVGFLPSLSSSTLAMLPRFSEVFYKCSNALFVSVKTGSEIKENGLLSGSDQWRLSEGFHWWTFVNWLCAIFLPRRTSSEKHLVLLLTFLLSVSKIWCHQE